MESQTKQQLIEAAIAVRGNAYAPYSGFQVGAAVLVEGGRVFTGANVENVSYGLSICAERVAAAAAVAAGERSLVAVAVATSGGASSCGACRQFLAEFGAEMVVLMVDVDRPENVRETTLGKLLPEQFCLGEK